MLTTFLAHKCIAFVSGSHASACPASRLPATNHADAPWSELRGKPRGMRGLATLLKRYGVSPRKVKVGRISLQGYRREHLWDACLII
jgi:Protein of unknown function (DUF3631)